MKKDCPRAIDHCGLKTCARWPPIRPMAGEFLGWLINTGITPISPSGKKCAMTRARLALGLSQTILSGTLP